MSKIKPYINKYISHLYLYILLLYFLFSLLSSLLFLLSSLFFLFSFFSLISSFSSLLSPLSFLLFVLWLFLARFLVRFFLRFPYLRIQVRMPIFANSIKIEVPRPRDYAHRVERKKLIQITGVQIAVGVLKVGFVKKQGFG